jgi:hypothetical protein
VNRINEREVYVTSDGLGRGALVEEDNGQVRIFIHWKWAPETRAAFNVAPVGALTWPEDRTLVSDLYKDVDPQPGIYDSVDAARNELLSINAFRDAKLLY